MNMNDHDREVSLALARMTRQLLVASMANTCGEEINWASTCGVWQVLLPLLARLLAIFQLLVMRNEKKFSRLQ